MDEVMEMRKDLLEALKIICKMRIRGIKRNIFEFKFIKFIFYCSCVIFLIPFTDSILKIDINFIFYEFVLAFIIVIIYNIKRQLKGLKNQLKEREERLSEIIEADL